MNASIEMKLLEIDKLLEQRKQLITMQNALGLYLGLDESEPIAIYNIKELVEIADYIKENIWKKDRTLNGMTIYFFHYKGVEFRGYVFEHSDKDLVERLEERCKKKSI